VAILVAIPLAASIAVANGRSTASADHGDYHLRLVLPKTVWNVGEQVTGTATLSCSGAQACPYDGMTDRFYINIGGIGIGHGEPASRRGGQVCGGSILPDRPLTLQVSDWTKWADLGPGIWTILAATGFEVFNASPCNGLVDSISLQAEVTVLVI